MARGSLGQLLICVLGIYGSFLSWAVLQEQLMTKPYEGERFQAPIVLSLAQAAGAVVCGIVWQLTREKTLPFVVKDAKLVYYFARIAITATLSSYFGYASMAHISYPMVILGKSCKLLPVMALHVVLYKRRFPPHKYLIVSMVTAGVAMFSYFSKSSSSRTASESADSIWGLSLLFMNLLMDGITNTTQDKVFTHYKLSSITMMVAVNVGICLLNGAYLLSPWCHQDPWSFIHAHPSVLYDIGIFGAMGAIGQLFIFYTLEKFGSITLVTITLTRKVFTMLLSVVHFHHKLNPLQWVGVLFVFSGISLEAFMKAQAKKTKLVDKKKE
ncbi:uridine diphosphate-N-acetylglucosamine transporter Hut1 [Schizosaccharomyces japonicus yFS275]|uniref:UDP-galactose transporter homolog 1 n=1 Tax=Schizosaccharomyces japonicus (strain yFS275 / FY16936) TaxID=402676 RepID=B6K633_SCHJY|nr:uridine diphosphate-N-acetylglucosamine transporter Hut1 [Schizosaccharomyces japonicus yFS275]EEB08987.1 uridine diphosphate-N-acetylglucosamine transporter Hut1 [Schizosaccharomyces japonicus yFS275]